MLNVICFRAPALACIVVNYGLTNYNSALLRFLAISKKHTVRVKCLYLEEYYRLMNVNLYIGFLIELKTVQTQLYMPAYHQLFSYAHPFVKGGAHSCIL